VVEANVARRTDGAGEPVGGSLDGYVVLAADADHDYCAHTVDGDFHVVARSDQRSLARRSTFSDLIVAAVTEFHHPFG
jgi:hypothetical protein